jgi:hypothetical protein
MDLAHFDSRSRDLLLQLREALPMRVAAPSSRVKRPRSSPVRERTCVLVALTLDSACPPTVRISRIVGVRYACAAGQPGARHIGGARHDSGRIAVRVERVGRSDLGCRACSVGGGGVDREAGVGATDSESLRQASRGQVSREDAAGKPTRRQVREHRLDFSPAKDPLAPHPLRFPLLKERDPS